jgi:hypothetical protein
VRPNTRVQRTRSSPSAPHSPLTRYPLGGKMSLFLAVCALGMILACSTAGAQGPWCAGSPVEFGTVEVGGFGFRVVDSTGHGVPALVRYRRDAYLLHPGSWEQSPTTDDGQFGVADGPDGRYEVEVCGSNARPIHGYLNVVPGSPVRGVTLRFTLSEGR